MGGRNLPIQLCQELIQGLVGSLCGVQTVGPVGSEAVNLINKNNAGGNFPGRL